MINENDEQDDNKNESENKTQQDNEYDELRRSGMEKVQENNQNNNDILSDDL